MFIKLTRKDGSPIWINATSVVTVEPARESGAIVVPAGDDLDYEVVESPETVVALLTGEPPPEPPKKAKRATRKTKAKADGETETAAETAAGSAGEKPKKTAKRATRAKKAAPDESEPPAEPASPAEPEEAPAASPVFFPAEHLERVRKMAPGSVRKLANTLATQFKIEDPDSVVRHLEETGVISVVEHGHVNWLPPSADNVLKP